MISLIGAMDRNRYIGLDGDMPWGNTMKADLRRFKELTQNHMVVMGRKTFESLPNFPYGLPNRTNIIISRDEALRHSYPETVLSLEQALKVAQQSSDEVFVIGGAQIYEQFLPYASKIYLTKIHHYFSGDTSFPPFPGGWQVTQMDTHPRDAENPYGYTFYTFEKRG